VLRAARAMREHDAILLIADDPVALTDIPALARANGWAIELREATDHAEYRLRKAQIVSGR
jgi:TusA-related sulfurtransferase